MQPWFCFALSVTALALPPLSAHGQQEQHGRKYKAPPPTATVVVSVEKGFNGKPLPNASVIFRAVRNDADDGNLEMKTDPDGKASIDLLEVGSHVTVQVIADGFATYATDFDLTNAGKTLDVRLLRPRAQVSTYTDDSNGPAKVEPGIQEHDKSAPATTAPATASPTAPLQTTPPANTPSSQPAAGAPATGSPATGSPQ